MVKYIWCTIESKLNKATNERERITTYQRRGSALPTNAMTGTRSKEKEKEKEKEASVSVLNNQTKKAILVGGTIQSVSKTKYNALVKLYNELRSENVANSNAVSDTNETIEARDGEIDDLKSTITELKDQISDLENTISELQVASKANKSNQKQDMVDQVGKATREYVFRTVKFYEGADDLVIVTKRVVKYIRTALGMPEEEFVSTYSDVVSTALSDQRNYVQSEAKKRAFGKYIVRDSHFSE